MDQQKHEQFVELFVRNQACIYRYIVSLVPHRADADELFQQTNLTLWKTWDRFDTSRAFLPWAFGIAQNEVRNFLRRQKTRPRLLSDELIAELAQTWLADQEILTQRQDALTGCLERLAPQQKELIDLCYAQSSSMKVVAQSRDQTPEAVYKAVQRIRQILFDCVNRSLALGAES